MIIKQTQSAKKKFAVCLVSDHAYLPWALYLATQIARVEKDRNFDICIVSPDDFSDQAHYSPNEIRFIQADARTMMSLDCKSNPETIMYYKAVLPRLFADDYERILYLDSDIVQRRTGLSRAFELDLGEHPSAVARDCSTWFADHIRMQRGFFAQTGIDPRKHLNTGVILFDTERWLKGTWETAFFRKVSELDGRFPLLEQTVFNMILADHHQELSHLWNFQLIHQSSWLLMKTNPVAVHLLDMPKPWMEPTHSFYLPYREAYRTFAERELRLDWESLLIRSPGIENPNAGLFNIPKQWSAIRNPFYYRRVQRNMAKARLGLQRRLGYLRAALHIWRGIRQERLRNSANIPLP